MPAPPDEGAQHHLATLGGFHRVERRATYALLVASLLLPYSLAASPWRIQSGVSVQEIYSDNINLAPPGQEKSDFVTNVTPRFSVRSGADARGRITANLDYQMQTFTVGGGEVPNSIRHNLQLIGNAEVWQQIFFIDFRSSVSQRNVADTGTTATDNVSDTGNSTGVVTWSLSPYVVHHFGKYADGEGRITFDDVAFQDVDNRNSRSARLTGFLTSGRYFSRFPWNVNWSQQKIDNEDGSETTFNRYEGTLSYRISRKYRVFGNLGIDDNDFATSQPDQDGIRWRLGGIWTPSPRTFFQLGYGEQFSGSNISFNLSHRHRRTIWSASWSEDVTTTRQTDLERELIPLVDAFGEPILDDTGEPVLIPLDSPTITNEVLVNNRLRGSMNWRGTRSDFGISVFTDQRQFQVSGNEDTVTGISATTSRRLSRSTRLRLSGNWQQSEFNSGVREDTRWSARVDLTHRFSRDLNSTLGYRYQHQESTLASRGFDENRVTLRANLNF